MVNYSDVIAFCAVCISLITLLITVNTTIESRRGVVFKQYCDEFRTDPSIKTVIKSIRNKTDIGQLSSYDISVFLFFCKEILLQINSGRIRKDVASLMFLSYAQFINNHKDKLNPEASNSEDWDALEYLIDLLKNKPIHKMSL